MICPKCKTRTVVQPFKDAGITTCYICHLKQQGKYKLAMKHVQAKSMDGHSWWDWNTGLLELKTGWSFVQKIAWQGAFSGAAGVGTGTVVDDLREYYTDWQLEIFAEHYPNLKEYIV